MNRRWIGYGCCPLILVLLNCACGVQAALIIRGSFIPCASRPLQAYGQFHQSLLYPEGRHLWDISRHFQVELQADRGLTTLIRRCPSARTGVRIPNGVFANAHHFAQGRPCGTSLPLREPQVQELQAINSGKDPRIFASVIL